MVVQELHFGCGREDAQWTMDSGWQAYITAEAGQRYAGVGILFGTVGDEGGHHLGLHVVQEPYS